MFKHTLIVLIVAIFFSSLFGIPVWAKGEWQLGELTPEEIRERHYYRIIDEEKNVLAVTGRRLYKGDEYLTGDNCLYEIYKVKDYIAYARYRETIKLVDPLCSVAVRPHPARAEASKVIAIYHTHNAESYVPTDGADSIYGSGGVHDVGDVFKEALEAKGIKAIHNESMHLPHDRGAYLRARETALKLLEEKPDAIFDIHRDAAPPEEYTNDVEGELIAQIEFVVGMQNPRMAVNRQFAFDLKGYADRMYPNLVRGVLLSNGNYNQDIYPTMLLLEAGSHLVPRENAEEGMALFSDVVAFYFYGPNILENKRASPAEQRVETKGGGVVGRTIMGMLTVLAIGGAAFYFINNPGSFNRLLKQGREKLFQVKRGWPQQFIEIRKMVQSAARQIKERVMRYREKLKNR